MYCIDNVHDVVCCQIRAPFARRWCENDTESLWIRSSSHITKRACLHEHDQGRSLRLVRRRSRVSSAVRQRLKNIIDRAWTGRLCASNTSWFDRCFQMYRRACIAPLLIDHMQISAPFCFGCGRHIERGFAGSEPHSIQVRLHCRVSEFWSHCNVLQELRDSRLSFLRHMAESIDSQGAEQEEVGFHSHSRWLSLLFKLK